MLLPYCSASQYIRVSSTYLEMSYADILLKLMFLWQMGAKRFSDLKFLP